MKLQSSFCLFIVLLFVTVIGNAMPSLDGQYASPCQLANSLQGLVFEAVAIKDEYAFADGQVVRSIALFADAKCEHPLVRFDQMGTAKIGLQTLVGFSLIDFELPKLQATFFDAALVNRFNRPLVPSCSIKDWKIGEARTLSLSDHFCPLSFWSQSYDLIQVDEASFALGLKTFSVDGASKETRPIVIDSSRRFFKR